MFIIQLGIVSVELIIQFYDNNMKIHNIISW